MSFESTLAELPDPAKRIASEELTSLSHLETDERRQLTEIWPEIEVTRRLSMLSAMTDMAQDNVELNFDAVFKLALDDEDPEVRIAGLLGLFEYEGSDLIRVLIRLLRDDEEYTVRREAAIALGRYAMAAELGHLSESDAEDIRSVLIESTEDDMDDELVRARAMEAVGAFSGEEIDNLIESIYRDDSIYMKVGAVDAMGRSANEQWLPMLLEEVENPAPEMRHAAAYALGQVGSEQAIQPLKRMAIMDPDREVQLAAVRALGEIGGQVSIVALKSILYEGDDDLRDVVQEAIVEAQFYDEPLSPIL